MGMRCGCVCLLAAASVVGADSVRVSSGDRVYRFEAESRRVFLVTDGGEVPILEGAGPLWDSEFQALPEEAGGVRGTVCLRQAGVAPAWRYHDPGRGGEWELCLAAGVWNDLVISFRSQAAGIAGADPGVLPASGAWVGLDLSQYQLAHGQTSWPKTYFLPGEGLFVCAWWDWETSHATRPEWPAAASDPRTGRGPCAAAATMRYEAGPEGRCAFLREALHIRAGVGLWDVALPSLAEPSAYREELARMVYLDVWGCHPAAEIGHALDCLRRLAFPDVRFLTILQNWQAGGFDSLLPDSIRMPDYPPNPACGSVADLREVARAGARIGRVGFRTNYSLLRPQAPSHREGLVGHALGPDGRPKWHAQPSRWQALAARQEGEIAALWPTSAAFLDQLASGGGPQAYVDSGPGGTGTLAATLRCQRQLARLVKAVHQGPLGSETLNQQDLVGAYCDFGDFSILGGHERNFPVDYKLRRLHELTVAYGCGLPYRFFELPPFQGFHSGTLRLWDDPGLMDDYRCCEVLLGNAAYLFWPAPWDWALTECMLVGRLQRFYALDSVASVHYLHEGRWQTLEELVRAGFLPEARPWRQKQPALARVRVAYRGGLVVFGNRLAEEMTVETPAGTLVLPRAGWVAFTPDAAVLAYSAFRPGTRQRVDCIEERAAGRRFLNPRGAMVEGSREMRLECGGACLWSVDAAAGTARIGDRVLSLSLPPPPPVERLAFRFAGGLADFRPVAGVLRVEPVRGGCRLVIVSDDPQLVSPPLRLEGRAEDVFELVLSAEVAAAGQLYFATAEDGVSERQVVRFAVAGSGAPERIVIPVGTHPRWPGERIERLRLDPVHGAGPCHVVLHSLRRLPQAR
ncbi:MAG: hypothetical protein JXR77_11140 [Lentisphaeria bacterium]|nr:hypothetical protein [Lentisphaeria bacterium]